MSESLSQLILKSTRESAENTRVIRELLEEHIGSIKSAKEPRTEVKDNLDKFVIPVTDELPEVTSESVAETAKIVDALPECPAEMPPQSRAEEILKRFKKRVGG